MHDEVLAELLEQDPVVSNAKSQLAAKRSLQFANIAMTTRSVTV